MQPTTTASHQLAASQNPGASQMPSQTTPKINQMTAVLSRGQTTTGATAGHTSRTRRIAPRARKTPATGEEVIYDRSGRPAT